MKGQATASKREAKKKAEEFYATAYPLAFHLDLDWQTRKTPPVSATYRCFKAQQNTFLADPVGSFLPSSLSKADCLSTLGDEWREFSPARPSLFVYSNSETPPLLPPELMRRMAGAGLESPSRFVCRVEDVVATADGHDVKCRSNGQVASVRATGELRFLNVRDLVSVPMASTRRDPNGVLFKKGDQWVVDADAGTLTVDAAATCPSVEEIISSATGGGK